MKQEALEKLPEIRDELEAAVLDILEDKPDGIRTRKIMFHISDHPCDVDPDNRYIYVWMAELKRDGVIVIDRPAKRYLHPKHADRDPEEYRYGGRPLDLYS